MARYIDADKLWNNRPQVTPEASMDYKAGFSECMWAFSKAIKEQIDKSAVDVVPKSEGEWIYDEERVNMDIEPYICSVCQGYSEIESKYCPNCGAKMKGGE